MLTLTAGTMFTMWLGEKITEERHWQWNLSAHLRQHCGCYAHHLGKCISCCGRRSLHVISLIVYLLITVAVIAAVVMITRASAEYQFNTPSVSWGAECTVASPHIPLKVNQAGVIPVIFASSVLTFPLTLAQFIPGLRLCDRWLDYGTLGTMCCM